jgi:hypothetical protein
MQIKEIVLKKIQEEKLKHPKTEFGGYLLVKDETIYDIIFDIDEENTNAGFVQFDVKQIMKLPESKRRHVRGWFHEHPIIGMSVQDTQTTSLLTNLWGECYTLVLQQPTNQLLCVKTIKGTPLDQAFSLFNKKSQPTTFITEKEELQMENDNGETKYLQKSNWIAKLSTVRLS